MRNYLCHRFIAVTVLASVLISQSALSMPLFDEGSWRAYSFYTRTVRAGLSSGIGGLQVEIKKARQLNLKSSDISYSDGYLRANIEDRQLKVKVSPNIVREAIKVVEEKDTLVFQVSIDQTALGRNNYIDEELQHTKIGNLLLYGDLDFASIVNGRVPLPKPQPTHPYNEALRLLKTDAEYRKLPTQWGRFPKSYPQIYMHFNPVEEGLVSLEFKPQVFFRAPSGIPLEVDKSIQTLGELPYLPLVKDVKDRPLAYRKISRPLEVAASITATLGILEAACKESEACIDLSFQTINSSENNTNDELKAEIDRDAWRDEIKNSKLELDKQWASLNIQVFQPGNADEAWASA